MTGLGRTPLAWKNLTHNVRRLLVAVSGVTFAVVLMFMERGFQNALFDSTVELVRNFDADMIVTCRSRYSLSASSRFPLSKLTLARGFPGVEATYPVYLESYLALLRKPRHKSRPIRVVGFNVRADIFCRELMPTLIKYRPLLEDPEAAIIDVKSKESIYGIDPSEATANDPLDLELAGKHIQLVGTFQLGTDFANDGTLFMSLENFAHYFPMREYPASPLSTIDLGLIICRPGTDLIALRAQLQHELGSSVNVATRDEYVTKEISFWDTNTPIGVIFRVGMIMGFVVGVLICYQVLYNDITDHMPEFATLMAMGYGKGYFISLVVREAVYLSLFGFVPGLGISWLLFQLITAATGLTMTLALPEIAMILGVTIVMCVTSGLLAVRKLLAADPASLF